MIANCTVHQYSGGLISIEHPTQSGVAHENILLFVGGLTDGLFTVPYVRPLAKSLDRERWGVAELLIRSSYTGYGSGSLERDAEDIAKAVKYFRNLGKKKVVVMGHSTGSQDVMYYLTNKTQGRPEIDGGIIQASVSDRQVAESYQGVDELKKKVAKARELIEQGKGKDCLPRSFDGFCEDVPTTAERFVSLCDVRGNDDFFSSDLNDDDFSKTFGAIKPPTKLLVAYSGSDECVPATVDKEALLARWKGITDPQVWSNQSGVVPGAKHNVDPAASGPGALNALITKVSSFLAEI